MSSVWNVVQVIVNLMPPPPPPSTIFYLIRVIFKQTLNYSNVLQYLFCSSS